MKNRKRKLCVEKSVCLCFPAKKAKNKASAMGRKESPEVDHLNFLRRAKRVRLTRITFDLLSFGQSVNLGKIDSFFLPGFWYCNIYLLHSSISFHHSICNIQPGVDKLFLFSSGKWIERNYVNCHYWDKLGFFFLACQIFIRFFEFVGFIPLLKFLILHFTTCKFFIKII